MVLELNQVIKTAFSCVYCIYSISSFSEIYVKTVFFQFEPSLYNSI
jgi:hypothetical protein